MTYENFIEKIKHSGAKINPYIPFNLDGKRWYEKSKPKDDGKQYIIQYWETGGVSGGSCWESSDPQPYNYGDSKKPKGFLDLSKLLIEICPNLTFLQFQILESEILEHGSEIEYEYYGNRTDYSYELVDLKKLYNKLKELEVI